MYTLVPSFRLERSRVSPAGTSILSNTMVEQDFLLALALAAEVKVQVEARPINSETREGAGAADTAAASASMDTTNVRILKQLSDQQTRKESVYCWDLPG
jgi:hypothetical protein